MLEFLICARHSTPTFGVIRPQHQAIVILPAAIFPQAPLQEAPALLPPHVDQHQELIRQEMMRRILPRRPAEPVPRDRMIFHYNITYTDLQ